MSATAVRWPNASSLRVSWGASSEMLPSRRITRTGKKKCMLTHFPGRRVEGARREIPSVELFVARIAWGGVARSSRAKHSFFGSRRSLGASQAGQKGDDNDR